MLDDGGHGTELRSRLAAVANFVTATFQAILEGLVGEGDDVAEGNDEPTAPEIVASGPIDEINATFVERGWTDGQSGHPTHAGAGGDDPGGLWPRPVEDARRRPVVGS